MVSINLEGRGSNLDALVDIPYLNQLLKGNQSKSINDNQFKKEAKIKCTISISVLNMEGRGSNLDALVDLTKTNHWKERIQKHKWTWHIMNLFRKYSQEIIKETTI